MAGTIAAMERILIVPFVAGKDKVVNDSSNRAVCFRVPDVRPKVQGKWFVARRKTVVGSSLDYCEASLCRTELVLGCRKRRKAQYPIQITSKNKKRCFESLEVLAFARGCT